MWPFCKCRERGCSWQGCWQSPAHCGYWMNPLWALMLRYLPCSIFLVLKVLQNLSPILTVALHCIVAIVLNCCYYLTCPKLQPETCDYMKSEDTSLFMLSLLMRSVEELVDQGVEILEELIAQHRHQGGIVLVATHVPINLPDALALRLPPR